MSDALVAAIVVEPGPVDVAASVATVDFADEVIAVCGDAERAQAYRSAGALVASPAPGACPAAPTPAGLPDDVLVAAAGGWLLVVSSAERVSHGLRAELLEATASRRGADALAMPVTRHLLGRYLRHGGWRTREPRCLRVTAGGRVNSVSGHASGTVDLEHPLVHLGPRRLAGCVERLEQRTRPHAGVAEGASRDAHAAAIAGRILRRLVVEQGFRDGARGLIAAVLDGVEPFVARARAWDAARREGDSRGTG